MKGFIYSNQSLVIVVAVVIFLVVLYFIIKALPIKVAKKQSKVAEKKIDEKSKSEAQESEKDKNQENIEEITDQEKAQEDDKKSKKEDKKPKIIQIYKRESREESLGDEKKKSHDPIYDRNVEFINTSKNVAKFKSFADENKSEETAEVSNTDEYGFVTDTQEDCNLCENEVKHFDHSRRLSKAIKEDNFDNMFESHISGKYLNINSDRHLNLDEKFQRKLFDRTEKMLANSDGKVKSDEHEKSTFSLFSNNVVEEDDEDDEDVQINMKTALLADTFLGKRKKNRK